MRTKRKVFLSLGMCLIVSGTFLIGKGVYMRYKSERIKKDLLSNAEQLNTAIDSESTSEEYAYAVSDDYEDDYSYEPEYLPEYDIGLTGDMKLAPIKDGVRVLEIPNLSIKAPVLEGVDNDTLAVSVGHFRKTGAVGEGNFCVAGHSVSPYACIFDNLHEVTLDLPVYLTDTDGSKCTYWVTDWFTVMPSETWVLNDFGDDRLTMITCDNKGRSRLVIIALKMTEAEHLDYVRNREINRRLEVKDISYDLANIDIGEFIQNLK